MIVNASAITEEALIGVVGSMRDQIAVNLMNAPISVESKVVNEYIAIMLMIVMKILIAIMIVIKIKFAIIITIITMKIKFADLTE
ncbi:MAG: hypothetical protein EZS28_002267, partial [Streblomastix strix]